MQYEHRGITKPVKSNTVTSRSQAYTLQQRFTMTVRETHRKMMWKYDSMCRSSSTVPYHAIICFTKSMQS